MLRLCVLTSRSSPNSRSRVVRGALLPTPPVPLDVLGVAASGQAVQARDADQRQSSDFGGDVQRATPPTVVLLAAVFFCPLGRRMPSSSQVVQVLGVLPRRRQHVRFRLAVGFGDEGDRLFH